jgi:hypothetical protein
MYAPGGAFRHSTEPTPSTPLGVTANKRSSVRLSGRCAALGRHAIWAMWGRHPVVECRASGRPPRHGRRRSDLGARRATQRFLFSGRGGGRTIGNSLPASFPQFADAEERSGSTDTDDSPSGDVHFLQKWSSSPAPTFAIEADRPVSASGEGRLVQLVRKRACGSSVLVSQAAPSPVLTIRRKTLGRDRVAEAVGVGVPPCLISARHRRIAAEVDVCGRGRRSNRRQRAIRGPAVLLRDRRTTRGVRHAGESPCSAHSCGTSR